MSEKLPIVRGTVAVQYFGALSAGVKAVLVPVGVDAVANGKMLVAAIECRSSWL